jgi:hypothetical protein
MLKFVSIKPLNVSVFFHDHLQGVLRSCLLVICSLSPKGKNTKHTQMIYICGHILRDNTNSTNANQREE